MLYMTGNKAPPEGGAFFVGIAEQKARHGALLQDPSTPTKQAALSAGLL